MRHNAVYFGLRGWWDKTPNVLRLFAEILVTEPDDHSYGSSTRQDILWSFRNKEEEKRFVATHLAQALEKHADYPVKQLAVLTGAYRELTDKMPPNYAEYSSRGRFVVFFRDGLSNTPEELQRTAQDKFGADPRWLHVSARQGKGAPQALVVVQGMDGLEWVVAALDAGKFSVDYGGPFADLEPEAIEKFGLEEYQSKNP
jgi:hypothetical protein